MQPAGELALPCSVDAERAILGSIILDNRLYAEAARVLAPADFYLPASRIVFGAIAGLMDRHQPADTVSIAQSLNGDLEAAGGVSGIAGLIDGMPRVDSVEHWARIVKSKAQARSLVHLANQLMLLAAQGPENVEVLIADTHRRLAELASSNGRQLYSLKDAVQATYQRIEQRYADHSRGLFMSLPTLSDMLGGLRPKCLYILSARPGVGKTAMATNNLTGWTFAGLRSLVLSVEMSKEDIISRMIAAVSGVSGLKLIVTPHRLDQQDFRAIGDACSKLSRDNLQIEDSGQLFVEEIPLLVEEARQRMGGIDVLVVDYLQILETRATRCVNTRAEYIATIARALKQIAKREEIPVLALSQMNRAGGDKPDLENLGESGQIEREAEAVMILTERDGSHDLLVKKNRNGPKGKIPLVFHANAMIFEEAS